MAEKKEKKESGEITRRGFLKDSGLILSGATIGSAGLLSVRDGEAAPQATTVSKFVCPDCEQEFDSLAELQSHFKDSHGEEPAPAALNIVNFNVNGRSYEIQVKPSRVIKEGDVIHVKRNRVVYSYRVKKLLGKRLSAKLVVDFVENITPEEELKKLEVRETFFIKRDKGTGRPTKKERRIIDKLRRSDE